MVTSSVAPLHITGEIIEHAAAGATLIEPTLSIDNAVGTFSIVAAPTGVIKRQIKELTIRNTSNSLANKITIQKDIATAKREIFKCVLSIENDCGPEYFSILVRMDILIKHPIQRLEF